MTDATLAKAEELIPAEVRMISGCRDEQTSADVANVETFQLPDPAGRAGGACTSAMLNVLYADHQNTGQDLSFQEVLLKMREELKKQGYEQIPQLTSSRPLDIKAPFDIVPPSCENGTRRAVLIGINYTGHKQGVLSGCINDAKNMLEYIKAVHGFKDENITLLFDDGEHTSPTKANILAAYQKAVSETKAGDALFCHYSGHGGKLRDESGDEKDGFDETLVPLDYETVGQILDDDLFTCLVAPLPAGSCLTCVMDCCHSGTVLDLPYAFVADGEQEEMAAVPDFDFNQLMSLFQKFAQSPQGQALLQSAAQKCMSNCYIL